MPIQDWGCGLVVECLPTMHDALGSIPYIAKGKKKLQFEDEGISAR